MFRKTAFALVAAATLGIATLAPSAASAKTNVSFSFGFHGGGFYPGGWYPGFYPGGFYPGGFYPGGCFWTTKQFFHPVYGPVWKKVKVCT